MRRLQWKGMPRHQTIVAYLAVFLALGGSSYAATRLTKGQAHSAAAKKRIRRGPPGPQGPAGPQGAQGAQGAQGVPGPVDGNLPSGVTLRGGFDARGAPDEGQADDAVSFEFTLSAAPAVHVIGLGSLIPAGCSGTSSLPGADPGNLCIFVASFANSNPPTVVAPGGGTGANRFGFLLLESPVTAGSAFVVSGTWAVTAP